MTTPTPTLILPVCNGFAALDRCLAAFERTLPRGTRVHVADDASADPRIARLLRDWRERTAMAVSMAVRAAPLGWAGNLNAALDETGDGDVVLLDPATEPCGDWWRRLARAMASDARIATATPFSNDGELASLPRMLEANPVPADLGMQVAAVEQGPAAWPELPTGGSFAAAVRRAAWRAVGAFDARTFPRGPGAWLDWCLRAAAHGWRHVLCDDAYVLHTSAEALTATAGLPPGHLAPLHPRWPDYNAAVARLLMADPLRPHRERVADAAERLAMATPQGDLFR